MISLRKGDSGIRPPEILTFRKWKNRKDAEITDKNFQLKNEYVKM